MTYKTFKNMTFKALKNRPLWTCDKSDVYGIQEHMKDIMFILMMHDNPSMKRLAFHFRAIEVLAKYAAECLENDGPEPGETEIEGCD